ncbi:ROK family protein [Corynebacterium lizhenjunii]|uniref:ROK family protein n=1 Tax=Corynebacterium lizhenjunii TaxID=2709394 RepID=UPI0013ED5D41|nr:ROK family protein [Corynebacterium lizhenjunii]
MTLRLGIDVGGTKIAAGLVDSSAPTEVFTHRRVATPEENVSSVIVELVGQYLESERGGEIAAIGIGAPGVIDPATGTVLSAGRTMWGWAGTELAAEVKAAFQLPVAVHNDVRVMALGETVFGAGQDFNNVLFVSFGTGVGGAIVRDGQLVDSPHHTAGELRTLWGPNPDGKAAQLENMASGSSMMWHYKIRAKAPSVEDLREVMERYHEGDVWAFRAIDDNMYCAGRTLAGFINAIDVDAVIVGGGVGALGTPVLDPLERGLRTDLMDTLRNIPVLPARLGSDAPIVGAAHYAATVL